MKILGEKIFAKDSEGRLISRIGTMFLRTKGLVTKRGVHAMQRVMWLEELAKERGIDVKEASITQLNSLWEEVKNIQKQKIMEVIEDEKK